MESQRVLFGLSSCSLCQVRLSVLVDWLVVVVDLLAMVLNECASLIVALISWLLY